MLYLPIFLLTSAAIIAASPLDLETSRAAIFLNEENTRNSILEQLVLSMLEEVRELMVSGSDTVPVLDPLVVDSLRVDENTIDTLPGFVKIDNMVVNGLSTFEINELSIGMTSLLQQRYRTIMDGSVPVVDVNVGGYDLNLSVLGGSVFGTGDATIKFVKPRVRTNVLMSIRLSGGIFINLIDCNIAVSLEALEPRITGMFNDPVISDFISILLKNLVEELLTFFEDEINELISTVVLEYGNKILADLDLSGILGI